LPKSRASRSAVSAEIERRPLRMSVLRPEGTPRSSARRLALSQGLSSSRRNNPPGCIAGAMFTLLRPRPCDNRRSRQHQRPHRETRHKLANVHSRSSPIVICGLSEPVQSEAFERTRIAHSPGGIERSQQFERKLEVQPAKLVWTLFSSDLLRCRIAPGPDLGRNVVRNPQCRRLAG
jgi:hypothetical protein